MKKHKFLIVIDLCEQYRSIAERAQLIFFVNNFVKSRKVNKTYLTVEAEIMTDKRKLNFGDWATSRLVVFTAT